MENNPGTVDMILNASEVLFAQKGFSGTSLREITAAARTNLASINYHFDSKEQLYAAVLRHRLRPMNELRTMKLDEAVRRAHPAAVPLVVIIELWAQPLFQLGQEPGGRHFLRIIGRSMHEPLPFMAELIALEIRPTLMRFGQAMRRHSPSLSPEDFLWRLNFVMGALHHTLATMHTMKEMTHGICQNDDHKGALQRFVQFAADALCAASCPARL